MKLRFAIVVLVALFVACSSESDKSLFESGKNKIKENNYIGAVNDFQKLVNEYPDSKYEFKALFELAKLYHGRVIQTLTKEESLTKAVELYKQVFEKNPKSEEGERALFMAGFLEANELNKFESAKETYNKFIETYPNSPLAASAKEEVKNLGIPPEEILKKKVTTAE